GQGRPGVEEIRAVASQRIARAVNLYDTHYGKLIPLPPPLSIKYRLARAAKEVPTVAWSRKASPPSGGCFQKPLRSAALRSSECPVQPISVRARPEFGTAEQKAAALNLERVM